MQLGGSTDDDLDVTLAQLYALEASVRRARAEVIAEMERRGNWVGDGARSMGAWLAYRFALCRSRASEEVRVAKALESLPAIAEALGEGRLSYDQTRMLTRYATADTDVDEAAGCSVRTLEMRARRAR